MAGTANAGSAFERFLEVYFSGAGYVPYRTEPAGATRHDDEQCLFVRSNLGRSLRRASACRALMRVLIVDDHADSAKSLVALLQELGHNETRVAYSAATALQTAVAFGPDIVLMDVELPDMSGYDAALLMHQHPKLQRTRLMALTDYAEHPRREQARVSGFERYLVKPVTVEALREVLDPAPS